MHHHHHIPMVMLQQQIHAGIALQGFAIRHVVSASGEPEFSYTVGLHVPDSDQPELFMSGLARETRVNWLLDIGFRIQGPPPLKTQRRMAQAYGVRLTDLRLPAGGQQFQPGRRYANLTNTNLPTCFGVVEPKYYEQYFGQAIVFHGMETFPILQIVWSDTRGRFPFEAHFERRFQNKQRLLFDPQHAFPLCDVESEEA